MVLAEMNHGEMWSDPSFTRKLPDMVCEMMFFADVLALPSALVFSCIGH